MRFIAAIKVGLIIVLSVAKYLGMPPHARGGNIQTKHDQLQLCSTDSVSQFNWLCLVQNQYLVFLLFFTDTVTHKLSQDATPHISLCNTTTCHSQDCPTIPPGVPRDTSTYPSPNTLRNQPRRVAFCTPRTETKPNRQQPKASMRHMDFTIVLQFLQIRQKVIRGILGVLAVFKKNYAPNVVYGFTMLRSFHKHGNAALELAHSPVSNRGTLRSNLNS